MQPRRRLNEKKRKEVEEGTFRHGLFSPTRLVLELALLLEQAILVILVAS